MRCLRLSTLFVVAVLIGGNSGCLPAEEEPLPTTPATTANPQSQVVVGCDGVFLSPFDPYATVAPSQQSHLTVFNRSNNYAGTVIINDWYTLGTVDASSYARWKMVYGWYKVTIAYPNGMSRSICTEIAMHEDQDVWVYEDGSPLISERSRI